MSIKTMTKLSFTGALILAMSATSQVLALNSNVKPIPENFDGKWAGLHSTKQKLSDTIAKDLCDNGGEQDTSYFVTFDPNRQRIANVSYWEDLATEYPVSYSKYTPNHIKGEALSISYEMGSDDTLSTKTAHKFDYRLANNILYIGTMDGKFIEMRRCR